jgi:DNA-binding GntR family transcriptional regulator
MVSVYAGQVPVDRLSPVPLPQQVAAFLRERIERDGLRMLPSLAQITQEYEVSRPTAEAAVKILVDAGEAVVVPGRGTFVTRNPSS